ncbi:MAG: hypothetical protein HONBIEJF_00262 [Fimbriimonadaceae bacterium]|nr:hypothetical protein [Fimbriimonadaceae bacterium]
MVVAALVALCLSPVSGTDVRVRNDNELRQAVVAAKPGDRILIEPGSYRGGISFQNLAGKPGQPIVIAGGDPKRPPKFSGGGSAIHLSDISHVELRDIQIVNPQHNGLNIDDGGTLETPSHHVVLANIQVSDMPAGNNDGIKLSGLDDFVVRNCTVQRWGGSAIDMVGCHRGRIEGCTFRKGGSSGVQAKGGSSEIVIQGSLFHDYGERGVNLGGSTGEPYFRPPISMMPAKGRYEARDLRVTGCTFVGGTAPIAFVGVTGAHVDFNTIYVPKQWAMRILQETTSTGFLPSQRGRFTDNLVIFRSDQWAAGGVNIGPGTQPETFTFERNFWYCMDRPSHSRPQLPTAERDGQYGLDPQLSDPDKLDFRVQTGSPAKKFGAHAGPGPIR